MVQFTPNKNHRYQLAIRTFCSNRVLVWYVRKTASCTLHTVLHSKWTPVLNRHRHINRTCWRWIHGDSYVTPIVTARKRNLGQGKVFTGVCLFTGVCIGGWGVGQTLCPWDTKGYGKRAGSMHPTGMPSCLNTLIVNMIFVLWMITNQDRSFCQSRHLPVLLTIHGWLVSSVTTRWNICIIYKQRT